MKNTAFIKSIDRIAIENIIPNIDCGRYAAKCCIGEVIEISADIFADGHDVLNAYLLYKHETETTWTKTILEPIGNDRWQKKIELFQTGYYYYTISAFINIF